MGSLGTPELLVVLVIVLLLFGVGRVSKLGGELGEAVASFRKGVKKAETEDEKETEKTS